jgi:NAD(P)-dependent dehydrogenase (short-subunit alcohol dehydrogenase family)
MKSAVRERRICVSGTASVPASSPVNAPWPVVRDMSLEFWNSVFETNVTGMFLCSKHVIPHMERQGGGVIVTSSITNEAVELERDHMGWTSMRLT